MENWRRRSQFFLPSPPGHLGQVPPTPPPPTTTTPAMLLLLPLILYLQIFLLDLTSSSFRSSVVRGSLANPGQITPAGAISEPTQHTATPVGLTL